MATLLGFERLIEDRLDAMYRLAAVLLEDPTEAEDAAHEAVLKAYRGWPGMRDHAAAAAWLDRIVVNECRDRLRRRRRARGVLASLDVATEGRLALPPQPDPAVADAVREALASLEPDHRIVIVLRYFLDLPLEAIATRTGVSIGTIKSRLHYAQSLLRAAYEASERREVGR